MGCVGGCRSSWRSGARATASARRCSWGERVTAVVQLHPERSVTDDDVRAFVKARIGSVKAPKRVEVWPDIPRSKVGKVLKGEVRSRWLQGSSHG
ncbi:AMP-binding enzyme [Streptomyces sp. CA-288835]|uniref:AMP-binding enzyme n=1 Tax=Streptomyces sp. CA-288835 TaxID=3240069 RepID=UPI003D8B59BD